MMNDSASRQRPRLLFLCQTLPYPPDGGVAIRSYNTLRLLARAFDITALCFYRWKSGALRPKIKDAIDALSKFGDIEAFPIPQEHSRGRLLADHLRSVVTRRVYTVQAYESRPFRRRLARSIADCGFDMVHLDSLDLSAYLPYLRSLPTVCVHHNVESQLLRRRAPLERSSFRRAYLAHQAELMEHEEQRWCPRVALNVAVSRSDADALRSLAPDARIAVVPNGVDTSWFEPKRGRDHGVIFVGGTTWFPNRDALDYFARSILPLVRHAKPDVPIRWVGRATHEERSQYQQFGIELTGYVPDIRPHVQDAACFIVPLRVGGGTRLKILDAWAMGKAVVSTSIGCEGLEAKDGSNILIRDSEETFAEAVIQLLNDAELRHRLGANARATAEQIYSWEVIGNVLLSGYRDVLAASRV